VANLGDIHRIGGCAVENLRLTEVEQQLSPPGFSVLKAENPAEAARQMIAAFPNAVSLHFKARVVGSSTEDLIKGAGFELLANPTRKFPNHYRIIHPAGLAGFTEENLARLSTVFNDTVVDSL
jgi:hypothetical protein